MIDVTAPRKLKACLGIDLLKSFGADFQIGIRDPLFFAGENGRAIIYPVGHHIAIRDVFAREEFRRNDIMFIYNDNDVLKVTSMNISRDYSLVLVSEKTQRTASISIYNLSKLDFRQITVSKPKRKVISTIYSEFKYCSFSTDGNYIASLGVLRDSMGGKLSDSSQSTLHGVIWDVQIFQSYKEDNYKPKCVIVIPETVTKITIENKLICTTGRGYLSLWYIYENSVKEFKGAIKGVDITKNFVDHEWLPVKIPSVAILTEDGDIYILEGYSEISGKVLAKKSDEDEEYGMNIRVEKFLLKHHIQNCFNDLNITPCLIKAFNKGLVVGSTNGHLLFCEKKSNETMYLPIRYTKREKAAGVTGIAFCKGEDYMAVAYNSNEIATINMKNIFENLRSVNFDLKVNLVCDGFHQGPITAMDVALQRPIIVTTSNVDKTVRVWNFLTGHCEYCKIILTEKEQNQEKEMDILSVAIHPNGYYIAISDKEMIRFFHLCYKELRFYNMDSNGIDAPKANCHLLKFSYGGHLLAAVSGKMLYIIRSYTRETLKEFETPHQGEITNIFFHTQDYYVYTIGSDGLIVEYNLFNFHVEKLSNKYINYAGGSFSTISKYQTCIASCGKQTSYKFNITEVLCKEMESQETQEISRTNDVYITEVDKNLCSLCSIKSKRFDIKSYAAGSEDGYLCLYPQMLCQGLPKDVQYPWKSIKSHRGRITSIAYSRDTNLLFSAGDDGNIFIYCIHELPDGETPSFDDNGGMNQITSILDEGLGDNVLYPLTAIFVQEEQIQSQNTLIDDYKNQEAKLKLENSNKLHELEQELNKKRELDIQVLNEKLSELKSSKEGVIDHYKTQIKQLENEHRQILIDKEKQYTERIDQMSNTIHDLNSKMYSLKSEHDLELKKRDEGYDKKFKEIDTELRKKFEEIKSVNDKLTNDLDLQRKTEEYKFIHLDQEHEQEIHYNNQKFESIIAEMERQKMNNQGEIARLEDEKKKYLNELNRCETDLKAKTDQLKQHLETIKGLRDALEIKEAEKEDLKKKLQESEGQLQEKTKLAGFCSKLKNELYLKNVEVSSKYNQQQIENKEIRESENQLKNELQENINHLKKREKEINKNQLLLEDYKNKYEQERHNAKLIEKDFDNLLQKIYDTFQSNDKNVIIKGIRKIYDLYLTGDTIKKIDSSKLNVNIRDELTKQIDFLQKGIINVTNSKNRRERNQNNEISKKTGENAILIKNLNDKIKAYEELQKDHKKLLSDFSALKKQYEQAIRPTNTHTNTGSNAAKDNNQMSQTMYNFNNLPSIPKANNDMFSNTVFRIKGEDYGNRLGIDKKSWKDTRLYKGTTLSMAKTNRDENFKMAEIKRILEEKNEIIRRQRIEIQILQNNLTGGKKDLAATTYGQGFKMTSNE